MTDVKIVCIGDSTTYGFPYGHQDSWVKMLDDEIFGKVINKGINGDITSNMLNRFNRDVITYKPQFVIITGGINDVVSSMSLSSIKQNFIEMVEMALANNISPILGLPSAVDIVSWEKSLIKLRLWQEEYANMLNLNVINFAQAFYDNDGKLKEELLLADGGHPSKEGYKQMFKQINLDIFIP
ncbi:MAG TPA: GDSL-type esterase/lipase family protein [Syntrophomonadaceae bacterium]|nr:GDSL-type esterase/lipase family protein [Syntrophomonadaceae bacterium]